MGWLILLWLALVAYLLIYEPDLLDDPTPGLHENDLRRWIADHRAEREANARWHRENS